MLCNKICIEVALRCLGEAGHLNHRYPTLSGSMKDASVGSRDFEEMRRAFDPIGPNVNVDSIADAYAQGQYPLTCIDDMLIPTRDPECFILRHPLALTLLSQWAWVTLFSGGYVRLTQAPICTGVLSMRWEGDMTKTARRALNILYLSDCAQLAAMVGITGAPDRVTLTEIALLDVFCEKDYFTQYRLFSSGSDYHKAVSNYVRYLLDGGVRMSNFVYDQCLDEALRRMPRKVCFAYYVPTTGSVLYDSAHYAFPRVRVDEDMISRIANFKEEVCHESR